MSISVSSHLKEKVRQLPHRPGVYLMKDRLGQILYIGKAKDLKKRVASYFQPSRKHTQAQPKVQAMIPLIFDLATIEVRSDAEAILLEGRLIKEYKPRYNTDFTDDKRFLLVRVDVQNPMPTFRLVRNRRDDGARYFGPFARSGLLRKTLAQMRKKFGILLGDTRPVQQPDGSYMLYADIRQEIYGHPNAVTPDAYRDRVESACQFLEGKTREWIQDLEMEMQKAAENQEYEKAAEIRDALLAMKDTLFKTRKFTRNHPEGNLADDHQTNLEKLAAAVGLEHPPNHIECFDISHISGMHCVASMVHFSAGVPDKKHYRRYRIKSFVGNDDFRAMEEVVGRRYRRLHEGGQPFPDLILIDGGSGQVNAARKAFLILDLPPPHLIGLAKKKETIVFPDDRPDLNLSHHDPALRLLQRIRDEAHRFANSFNADLRSRKIRESVLDDFYGLGRVRKQALMEQFHSLERLKKASEKELQQVAGIGPKLAGELRRFLEAHSR